MKYSLVELAPVGPDGTKAAALERAIRAAQEAEELGYHRIWYAEHHGTEGYAAQDPTSLIARATQVTNTIRVGSGAVLLNHYSPFAVAEKFLQLEALAPGRIDLGLGRATGGPVIDAALQRDRRSQPVDDFSQQVQEILAYYYNAFDPQHPFADINITAGIKGRPRVWILGSSGNSAGLAGQLGLGYVFAGFLNAQLAQPALAAHRETFQATSFGPGEHTNILALNIVAADTEEEAHQLTWPARGLWQRVAAVRNAARVPTLAEATRELSAAEKAKPSHFDGHAIPAQLAGTRDSLREQLGEIVKLTGAKEIMIQDMLVDEALRNKSRAIIADVINEL